MNCNQLNNKPLEEILSQLGFEPYKIGALENWYYNPFRKEKTPSFKLNKRMNAWYLFSEGIGGNNVDFLMKYFNTSVKEVLEWASAHDFSSFRPQREIEINDNDKKYRITEIKPLENRNLKNYLLQRGLSPLVFPLVSEIHFLTGESKKLYAVGFQNRIGGWELRNAYYKGALLKKDISIISSTSKQGKLNQKKVSLFEGFMDALSYVEINKKVSEDIIVMNSTNLINKTLQELTKYSEIKIFLDRDQVSEKCKIKILNAFPNAIDCSDLFEGFNDLNEFLVHKNTFELKKTAAQKFKL